MSREDVFVSMERDVQQHRLRAVDFALARFLAQHDKNATASLLWLSALLSRQVADGHLCLDLDALATMAEEQEWPAHWRDHLQALDNLEPIFGSRLVANGTDGRPEAAPLVLDGSRLYLRRYWDHERQVATAIDERLQRPQRTADAWSNELARLFPANAAEQPNWPRIACALAARGSFSVITGGPGTGKTTTVVRLLGLLQTLQLRDHDRPLRIRLAAPTGKAAARLNASIAAQLAQLDVDEPVRMAIPAHVDTLHRLLGARPETRRFRHDRSNPLHLDVLVIDEASMVDLEMMSAVLAALPANARLVLLGDKDQLSSVEAGAVLGDLCHRAEAGHYSADTAAWLQATTGDDIQPYVRDDARALDQQLTMLRYSHRFGQSSGIGRLARAVNQGSAAEVQAMLDNAPVDLAWTPTASDAQLVALAVDSGGEHPNRATSSTAPVGYRHYLERLHRRRPRKDDGAEAHDDWARDTLQAFNRFQLLCALRRGRCGVDGLNRLIAEALHARGLIQNSTGWYEGRPVMVTRNDYALGLANGDVGICLRTPDDSGRLRLAVAFLTNAPSGSRIRHVLPARLGDVSTTYAMTVHKSQGSEFEHTALLLPDEMNPVLTRELLYTGITRARSFFSLLGNQSILEQTIARRTRRHSGLAARLADR